LSTTRQWVAGDVPSFLRDSFPLSTARFAFETAADRRSDLGIYSDANDRGGAWRQKSPGEILLAAAGFAVADCKKRPDDSGDESAPGDEPVQRTQGDEDRVIETGVVAKTCVFVGPTRVPKSRYPAIDFLPPAALGSVFRAVEQGYRRIGIIDGFFGNTPSVWHKEILFALTKGVLVAGAASTGALRAAELAPLGMRGIGGIYRLYRSGAIADDDEVCVTHAIQELDFMPLSEPMISIRWTLRRLRRAGVLSRAEEAAVAADLKAAHFSERSLERVDDALERHLPGDRVAAVRAAYRAARRDAKGEDGVRLLDWLSRGPGDPPKPSWEFPRTVHWMHQFEDRLDDVPKLGDRIA
jgi:hypothetical protein